MTAEIGAKAMVLAVLGTVLAAQVSGCRRRPPEPPPAEDPLTAAKREHDGPRRRTLLEQHLRTRPDSVDALVALGDTCFYQLRDRRCAEEHYRRALAIKRDSSQALLQLVKVLHLRAERSAGAAGQEFASEAEALALRLMALSPSCDARDLLGALFGTQRRLGHPSPKAIAFLQESLEACPDRTRQVAWRATLGGLLEDAGRPAEAEQHHCESVRLGGGAVGPCLTLRALRVTRAASDAAAIARYDPGDDWLGHFALGVHRDDPKHLEIAARLNPRFRPALDLLAERHHAAGRNAEACRLLERVVSLSIEEADASDRARIAAEGRVRREAWGCGPGAPRRP